MSSLVWCSQGFSPILYTLLLNQLNDLEKTLVKRVLGSLHKIVGQEFSEEIKGIAEYWNVDVGVILGMNLMYEFRKVDYVQYLYSITR